MDSSLGPGASAARPGPTAVDVVTVEVDGRFALFVPATSEVSFLNQTASDILRLCDGKHSVDEMVSILASAYGVSSRDIDGTVKDAIEGLARRAVFGPHPFPARSTS